MITCVLTSNMSCVCFRETRAALSKCSVGNRIACTVLLVSLQLAANKDVAQKIVLTFTAVSSGLFLGLRASCGRERTSYTSLHISINKWQLKLLQFTLLVFLSSLGSNSLWKRLSMFSTTLCKVYYLVI